MRNFLISLILLVVITCVVAKQCPDSSQCVDEDSTCCKLQSGRYGCCPLSNAVCCSDGIHCCPEGTKCDDKNGTCIQLMQNIRRPLRKPVLNRIENIVCPDGKEQCLDSQTCCKLQSGEYGCCPYAQGVCCSDELHCCPDGFACDVRHSRCIHKQLTNYVNIPKFLLKLNATTNSVICPNPKYQCPDGSTCCLIGSEEYGCCPLEDAVCCADKQHCCPHGTVCAEDRCERP